MAPRPPRCDAKSRAAKSAARRLRGNARQRRLKAYLDQILSLGLGDERLQLGRGEGVDQTGLGDDEQEDLGASEDGELVSLIAMVG